MGLLAFLAPSQALACPASCSYAVACLHGGEGPRDEIPERASLLLASVEDGERHLPDAAILFGWTQMTGPEKVDVLVALIRPILANHPPEIQGGALADLLSMFLAGHHPSLRDEMLTLHMETVRDLIKPNEEMLFERHGGKPPGWP